MKDAAYKNGDLDPESSLGFATITEYVVLEVLGDATKERFGAPYDLYSTSLKKINVKYSILRTNGNSNHWHFSKNINSATPDYYVCLGMDKHQTEILNVWIIPGDAPVVNDKGIMIYQSTEHKFHKYSVDRDIYNNTFQKMDIKEKFEFRNTTKPKVKENRYLYKKYDDELEELKKSVLREPPVKNDFMLGFVREAAPLQRFVLLNIVVIAHKHKFPLDYLWVINRCMNIGRRCGLQYVSQNNVLNSVRAWSDYGVIKTRSHKIKAINTPLKDIEEVIYEDPDFLKFKEGETLGN